MQVDVRTMYISCCLSCTRECGVTCDSAVLFLLQHALLVACIRRFRAIQLSCIMFCECICNVCMKCYRLAYE
jgi:hypothetical protein